jgi:hypothetical protein
MKEERTFGTSWLVSETFCAALKPFAARSAAAITINSLPV